MSISGEVNTIWTFTNVLPPKHTHTLLRGTHTHSHSGVDDTSRDRPEGGRSPSIIFLGRTLHFNPALSGQTPAALNSFKEMMSSNTGDTLLHGGMVVMGSVGSSLYVGVGGIPVG